MLNHFSNIVVAYDESELSQQALEKALSLAESNDQIEVDVVTVLDNTSYPYIENYVYFEEILEQNRAHVREQMDKLAKERLNKLPNKINTVVLEGNPAQKIVSYAEERKADLIVIGSRGLSGLKEFMLGSVSNKVVQMANCPILIIK